MNSHVVDVLHGELRGLVEGPLRRVDLVVGAVGNLVRVPLAFALLPRLGVEGVWWAIALSTLVKAPVKWLCFRRAPVDTAKLSVHPS